MSTVYLASPRPGADRVALKVFHTGPSIDPQSLGRFRREARIASSLEHPSMIRVFESGHDGDIHFLAMEYIDGSDLRTHLRRTGPFAPEEAVRIARCVCQALEYAHRWGVVHCDVNPRNILLGRDGTVKLGDFGIAESLNSKGGRATSRLGSMAYLSPEQARGGRVSPASDLYALGVVFFEMLTGRLPFEGDDSALLLQHLHAAPPLVREFIPGLPARFEGIIGKAMAKRLADRYVSAREFESDLIGETEIWRKDPVSTSDTEATRWLEIRQGTNRPIQQVLRAVIATTLMCVVAILLSWQRVIAYVNVPEVDVPAFVGQTSDQATRLARETGLIVQTIDRVPHTSVPEGIIFWQNPAMGKRVKRGHPVYIVTSSGAPFDTRSNLDRFFPPP